MDLNKETIAQALGNVLGPVSITERNDSPIRKAEGLEPSVGALLGETPEPFAVQIAGLGFSLTAALGEGHKTGLYLDQLQNYSRIAAQASGRRVLDAFSNQGGFALACAGAGATEISTEMGIGRATVYKILKEELPQ